MDINQVNKYLFRNLISVTKWFTETELKNIIGRPIMRSLGLITVKIKGGKEKITTNEAAREWQKMFPSKKMVPIVEEDDGTVYAEIKSKCPYRGTGNVEGCYRMMEYDRKMMEIIGADFVVIKSQAEKNVDNCLVAITNNQNKRKKLIDAHVRIKNEKKDKTKMYD